MESILVIGDTHFPYHHPDTFEFISRILYKHKPTRVVHVGDLTDSYAFSRYPKDPEEDECFTKEFTTVREAVKQLHLLVPSMKIMNSNHDDRLWNRATIAGIPKSLILPFLTIIGAQKFDWELVPDLILDDWYFCHYKGANITRIASEAGMSVVQGHAHTKLSAQSVSNLRGRLWGVECGCLLGDDRHAFAYNKASLIRPNLGCVLIEDNIPQLIPMNTTSGGAWDGVC